MHRDLKPANIFLHRPGTGAIVPKVLDFGISKFAGSAAPDMSTGLTQTGAVLGSPLYMSPEQAASDKTIDGRSDLHALGVVLWECLVGEPPFTADTYNNLVVRIITGERPRLSDTLPGVSPGVAAIVECAMARKRDDRFPTATAMAEAIEAEIARLPPSTSITARHAAAEVLGRMGPSSLRPAGEPAPAVGTTTGGVSVPSVRVPSDVSPAAFTLPDSRPRSSSETAFAATQVAVAETLSASPTAPTLVSAGTPVATTSAGPRSWIFVAAAAAAVALLGAALALGLLRHPVEPATMADPTASTSALTAAATQTSPPEPSSPGAPASSTAALPSASASAAVSSRALSTPKGAAPKRAAPTKKVDDSVQSSGF